MDFNLKANQKSIFCHHIDYASMWSIYIAPHHKNFLINNVEIGQKENFLLKEYSTYREKLGFHNESSILEWAYNGYEKEPIYTPLLKTIKHFNSIKMKSNELTLGKYFDEKSIFVKNFIRSLENDPFLKRSIKIAEKYVPIVKNSNIDKNITCFVNFSPDIHDRQGGANGEYIQFEIIENIDKSTRNKLIGMLVHEGIHNINNINKYVLNEYDKNNEEYWLSTQPKMNTKEITIFNEAFTQTISEILIKDLVWEERLQKFKNKNDLTQIRVWNYVKLFLPIFIEYDKKNITSEIAFDKLIKIFRSNEATTFV